MYPEISLDEIPDPSSGKQLIVHVPAKEMRLALLKRCSQLGWLWFSGMKPDDPNHGAVRDLDFLYLIIGCQSKRLTHADADLRHFYKSAECRTLTLSTKPSLSRQQSKCPLCGSSGDDIVFDFYCSNKGCRNYR